MNQPQKPPENQPTLTTAQAIGKTPAPSNNVMDDPDFGELNDNQGPLIAKRLVEPDFLNVLPTNPLITVRWVNRASMGGHRVDFHAAQGFKIARLGDAKMQDGKPLPKSLLKDGHIVYGDLILMKIPKRMYDSALLNNHNSAIKRVKKFGLAGVDAEGNEIDAVRTTINEVRASSTNRNKIQAFIPTTQELEAMVENPGPQLSNREK